MRLKFKWTPVEQEAFEETKQIVVKEKPLVHQNFNNRFGINTYARDYQLGAMIRQEGRPITFHKYVRLQVLRPDTLQRKKNELSQ